MTRPPCLTAGGTPKRAFYSPATAEREARKTRETGPDGDAIHVYQCPQSGRRAHWHVGHTYQDDPR